MKTLLQGILIICLVLSTSFSFADQLPRGDYLRTCINCRVVDDKLSCWCYSDKRAPVYSSYVGVSNCPHFINHHGKLACGIHAKALPRGSYQKTCRQCTFDGRNLKCQCRTSNRMAWLPTTLLNTYRCNVNIANEDGTLKCRTRKSRHTSTIPTGSYLASCSKCFFEKKSILGCYCKNPESRHLNYSRLFHPHRCMDIENIGGRLTCITQ